MFRKGAAEQVSEDQEGLRVKGPCAVRVGAGRLGFSPELLNVVPSASVGFQVPFLVADVMERKKGLVRHGQAEARQGLLHLRS